MYGIMKKPTFKHCEIIGTVLYNFLQNKSVISLA